MITVHHLENSRSQRILWLLEELELDYEIRHYARDRKTLRAPESLRAIHPLGKAPIVTDGDATLAESGAIIEYLLARYGNGRLMPPADTPERLRYSFWLHYAEGSAMPPLTMQLVLARIPRNAPALLGPLACVLVDGVKRSFLTPQLERHFDYWERELHRSLWFAGDAFSAADIQMSFPIEAANARVGLGERTKTRAFLAEIHARPAYRRALERGGPYALSR